VEDEGGDDGDHGEDVGIEAAGEDAAKYHPDLGSSAEEEGREEGEGGLGMGGWEGEAED
jgi:hypothetical protein